MIVNPRCPACLKENWSGKCPEGTPPEVAEAYRRRVRSTVDENPQLSSPEKDCLLRHLYAEYFGEIMDFPAVKRHFNALLLPMEAEMLRTALAHPDPLRRAIQFAMAGNFIDFSAMDSVDEAKLHRFIAESGEIEIAPGVLARFRAALAEARRLTYLLDNCGEIVMDRVLMQVIARLNPDIEITAVVKGGVIVNDATREDAEEVRLQEVARRVIDTGVGIAGAPEGRISPECRAAMEGADLILAKGQANYETLAGCGLNLYYIFMCKCPLFTGRFRVPLYTGLLVWERDALPEP